VLINVGVDVSLGYEDFDSTPLDLAMKKKCGYPTTARGSRRKEV
jgi:hypothetical protein